MLGLDEGGSDSKGGKGGKGARNSSCLTIFGLEHDATEREVHILFSNCLGYSRCIVVPGKTSSQKPYAFVQFESQETALAAMETRQGTTWGEGLQAVNMELARRDIPATFHSRQVAQTQAAWVEPVGPPAKRARQQVYEIADPAYPAYPPARGYEESWPASEEDGPKTLHVGGLPEHMGQAEVEDFFASNYPNTFIGCKLNPGGRDGKGSPLGRAFVGFSSHQEAVRVQGEIDNFNLHGSTLRAEWARTEFRPVAAAVGKGAAAEENPPAIAPASSGKGGNGWAKGGDDWSKGRSEWGKGGGWARGGGGDWSKGGGGGDWSKGGGAWSGGQAGEKRTLHFTNLPAVSEAEFTEFLSESFPDQVAASKFSDTQDGRPPVAWVLFQEPHWAEAVATTHAKFEWLGTQVMSQFARTELDPSKVRRF